ncbi:MAG TPA: hypothetical protein VEL28_19880 [Candidatus Binatia bacterium]|nr:hypothetical protein [Candidatus Binatia bacterium]
MRSVLLSVICIVLASPALAAGTKVKGNVVPVPFACDTSNGICEADDFCTTGFFPCETNTDCGRCSNASVSTYSDGCLQTSDCNAGSMSAKSKASISGAGKLSVKIKGVQDPAGQPVTTDGTIGTDDDYIVVLTGVSFGTSAEVSMGVFKIELKNGNGKLTVEDGGAALSVPDGTNVLPIIALLAPATSAATCPGGNSAPEVAARTSDADCTSGLTLGVLGIEQGN